MGFKSMSDGSDASGESPLPDPPAMDWLLSMIEHLGETLGDKTDGRTQPRITLQIGGLLLSGTIINREEFLRSDPVLDHISEAMGKAHIKAEVSDVFYIHLKDVIFIAPGGGTFPTRGEKGVFWRGRLDRVDGYSFSHISPVK